MEGIPAHPEGANVDQNIQQARVYVGFVLGPIDYYWFYERVRNGGPWDYKQRDRRYADFGNFNYGAVGFSIGISENILLRAAGWAQSMANTSQIGWGSWWNDPPYGDDPQDQRMIEAGIAYAKRLGY